MKIAALDPLETAELRDELEVPDSLKTEGSAPVQPVESSPEGESSTEKRDDDQDVADILEYINQQAEKRNRIRNRPHGKNKRDMALLAYDTTQFYDVDLGQMGQSLKTAA